MVKATTWNILDSFSHKFTLALGAIPGSWNSCLSVGDSLVICMSYYSTQWGHLGGPRHTGRIPQQDELASTYKCLKQMYHSHIRPLEVLENT